MENGLYEHGKVHSILIDRLSNPPIPAYPNVSLPYLLHTDGSSKGFGALLYQRQEGKLWFIGYGSRTFSWAEPNYHLNSGKLEVLTLKWAIEKNFRDYIYYGPSLEVYTDNHLLTNVTTSAELNATGHRWMTEFSDCNFIVKYNPRQKTSWHLRNPQCPWASRTTWNSVRPPQLVKKILRPWCVWIQAAAAAVDMSLLGTRQTFRWLIRQLEIKRLGQLLQRYTTILFCDLDYFRGSIMTKGENLKTTYLLTYNSFVGTTIRGQPHTIKRGTLMWNISIRHALLTMLKTLTRATTWPENLKKVVHVEWCNEIFAVFVIVWSTSKAFYRPHLRLVNKRRVWNRSREKEKSKWVHMREKHGKSIVQSLDQGFGYLCAI